MGAVTFEGVGKVYADGTRAVSGMDLEIGDGEFMVLVGPSGCGKTTALRMVAGLESISEGVLRIGERVVNHVPARDRDIAMVFQSYALYPHLTVYENIAFGLRLRRAPKSEIDGRVREAAHVCGNRVAFPEDADLGLDPDAPRVDCHHGTARLSRRANSGCQYGSSYARFSKRKPPPPVGTFRNPSTTTIAGPSPTSAPCPGRSSLPLPLPVSAHPPSRP